MLLLRLLLHLIGARKGLGLGLRLRRLLAGDLGRLGLLWILLGSV